LNISLLPALRPRTQRRFVLGVAVHDRAQEIRSMTKPDEAKQQPAQAPGDAESPAKGETDRTIERGIRHTDPTEPAQSEQKDSGRKPS
jgi:hypothetical protein